MQPIRVGICGLGTVGYGSLSVLRNNSREITRRLGQSVEIVQVATRSLKPGQDIGDIPFSEDVFAVADNPDVNIVLELIGGVTVARELVLACISKGKHVVTANKALIAEHGNEIFAAAQANNVIVAYEAAVAGGIPIIKALREGLASNHIQWLAGIINGTSNYILTEMQEKGTPFSAALEKAQQLGYAEADPTFDIEGIDAAHKLTILSSIAFGIPLQFECAYTEGISGITTQDISYARELGYRIKHLGITRRTEAGVELRVHPTLIGEDDMLANVNGVMNAVEVNGDAVGTTLYYGAGAGALPTASAVVADLIDIARQMHDPDNAVPALAFSEDFLSDARVLDIEEISGAYYLRITAEDRVGVLADITEILGRLEINIEAIIQKEPRPNGQDDSVVPVIILTHEVREATLNQALQAIEELQAVVNRVTRIRVATFNRA